MRGHKTEGLVCELEATNVWERRNTNVASRSCGDKISPVTLLRFWAKNEVVEDHVTERSLFKMDNFLRRDINGFLVLADCQFQYNWILYLTCRPCDNYFSSFTVFDEAGASWTKPVFLRLLLKNRAKAWAMVQVTRGSGKGIMRGLFPFLTPLRLFVLCPL